MIISIYGGGMALRGPPGSMNTAVDGMKKEQITILYFYLATLASFAISMVVSFFIVLTTTAAIVSCIFFCLLTSTWYYYPLRIYNRFRFDPVDIDFEINKKDNLFETFKPENIKFQGYLTKKGKATVNLMKDPWERRYYVLYDKTLVYYENKEMYEINPANIPREKQIHLEKFIFTRKMVNLNYRIQLKPVNKDDRSWDLICENEVEFNQWCELLKNIYERLENENSFKALDDQSFLEIF